MANYNNILEVNDLYTSFNIPAGEVRSVNGVSFALKKGRVLGIVGESGSGKSVTAYSIMQILQNPGRIVSGSIRFKGKELIGLPDSQLEKIRGDKIAIIFQDPMSSLNPVFTVGNQIMEAIKLHKNPETYKAFEDNIARIKKEIAELEKSDDFEKKEKLTALRHELKVANHAADNYPHDRAIEMLKLVGINEPEKRLKQYPFEFSGGMLQRIMIAMSLVCEPDLLIADEPTTALDVTIQAQILELLKDIQKKMGMAIIIITHDLGVVAQICDEIDVMYAGRIVERGTAEEIFYSPKHEYTKGLIKSIPQANDTRERLVPIEGNPVDVFCLPKGCSFAPRCSKCMKICLKKYPVRVAITEHHATSCFKYVIDAYKTHEITLEQLRKILYNSNEGTASFKPVTRMDILDAYNDYDIAKKQLEEAKEKEIKKEDFEKIEFKVKENKTNYKRTKTDFKVAQRNRRAARKDRPATERADMAKKMKDARKLIRHYRDDKVDKKSLYDYISHLSITSFPVDLFFNEQAVNEAKKKYLEAKESLKPVNPTDILEKTRILCEIDATKKAYLDASDKLARAKRVNSRLMRTRKALIKINTRRVKGVINNNINYALMKFKDNEVIMNKKELQDYFDNFYYANWDLDKNANKEESKILRDSLRNARKNLAYLRSNSQDTIRKSLKQITDLTCKYFYNQGDLEIHKYYLRKKKYFIHALTKVVNYNIKNKKIKGGN